MFVSCRLCKDSPIKGKIIYTKNGENFIKDCQCWIDYKVKKELELALEKANIHKDYLSLDFSTYKGNRSKENIIYLQKYIDNFNSVFKDHSVYFYGANGTQKTTLSTIVAVKLLQKNYSVYKLNMKELVSLLQSEHFDKTTEDIETLHKKDLLIIDESFAKDKVQLYHNSDYQISVLTTFLKDRIEKYKKAIIFISNKKITDISSEGFGESIQDLLYRNCRNYSLEFLDNYTKEDNNDFKGTIWDII